MDDGILDISSDLTSTVSDVLLSTKNDKRDANDSTPTSSTDAASSSSGTALIVSEDPISSTSSDVMERDKLLPGISQENNDKDAVISRNLLGTDGDVDLLDMSMANVSSEPIIEDVEDIVQDLENLLGEPEPRHDFPTRRKEKTLVEDKDLLASLDDPLGEKIEPQTSAAQLTEKPETDETKNDLMFIIEPEDVENKSSIKIDVASEKCHDLPVPLEESFEIVENLGIDKTEDVNSKSDELQVATSDTETLEDVGVENEVSVVTSSETVSLFDVNNKNLPSSELNHDSEVIEEPEKLEGEKDSSIPEDDKDKKISEVQDSSILTESKDEDDEEISISQTTDHFVEEEKLAELKVEDGNLTSEPTTASISENLDEQPLVGKPEILNIGTPKTDVEVDGNVTSSSDLSNKRDSNVEKLEIPDCIFDEGLKENTEEIPEEPQEIMDCEPTAEAEIQEIEFLSSNEANTEHFISTGEEIPMSDQIIEQYEEIITSEENLTKEEETSNTVLEEQSETVSEDNPAIEQPSKLENPLTEEEPSTVEYMDSEESTEISTKVEEAVSETVLEDNTTTEQLSVLKNPVTEEDPSAVEDLEKSPLTSTIDEEMLEAVLEEQSETISEVKPTTEQLSVVKNAETEKEPSAVEDVEKSPSTSKIDEEMLEAGLEEQTETVSEDKSKTEQLSVLKNPVMKEDPSTIEDVEKSPLTSTIEEEMLEAGLEEQSETVSEDKSTTEQLSVVKNPETEKELSSVKDVEKSPLTSTIDEEMLEAGLEEQSETVSEDKSATEQLSVSKNPETEKEPSTIKDVEKSPLTSTIDEEMLETGLEEQSETVSEDKSTTEQLSVLKSPGKDPSIIKDVEQSLLASTKTSTIDEEMLEAVLQEQSETVSEENSTTEQPLVLEIPVTEKDANSEEKSANDEEILEEVLEVESETVSEEQASLLENPVTEEPSTIEDADSEEISALASIETSTKDEETHEAVLEEWSETVSEDEPSTIKDADSEEKSALASIETSTKDKEILEAVLEDQSEMVSEDNSSTEQPSVLENPVTGNIEDIDSEQKFETENSVKDEETPEAVLEEQSETVSVYKLTIELPRVMENPVEEPSNIKEGDSEQQFETENLTRDEEKETLEEVTETVVSESKSTTEQKETVFKGEATNEAEFLENEVGEEKLKSSMEMEVEEESADEAHSRENLESSPTGHVEEEKCGDIVLDNPKIQDAEETHTKENEVIEEIEQKLESVNLDEVETEDVDMPEEGNNVESIVPVEESELGRDVPDSVVEVSCSISTPKIVESAEDQPIDRVHQSTEDNLVPVNEEICVKKVIVYDHDCHAHKSEQSNITQNEDNKVNQAAKKESVLETEQLGVEKIPFPVDSTVSDRQYEDDQNEESTVSPEVEQPHTEDSKIETQANEEVSSSDQHNSEEITVIPELPSPVISKDTIIESSQEKNVEEPNAMEDQTSAAVQSILDNMLTEERTMERIIEKEEPPVVHSSYSSYEVQKAVQEIQGINLTQNIVEISPEEIECISSTEKPYEPENIEVSNEVETQISESKESEESTISKTENVQAIETPEEICDDTVEETIQEFSDNTENRDSTAHNKPDREDQPLQPTQKYSGTIQKNDPVVVPSIDLSEESSSEEGSDEDRKHNVVSSSVPSTFFIKESHIEPDHKEIKIIASRTVPKVSSNTPYKNEPKKFSPRETRHSSRISEKMKPHNLREDMDQPLSVNVEEIEREKPYSPKITIKPIKEDEPNEEKEEHKGSLKITITKQSDNTHSILKMCSPDVEHRQKQSEIEEQNVVPKLVIKTDTHSDQHSPKMSTRSSKQVLPSNSNIRSGSPRITIKPIVKPESRETITSPLKITIKPIGKPEEFSRQQQRHSPKQTKNKGDDDHYSTRSKVTKTSENSDVHSPKVTIKPVKPPEDTEVVSTPKITIKPIEKPDEARVSPKITIKPVVRPVDIDAEVDDEVKERIVLKINKGNLPAKESRKRELEDDKSEKLAKIKLKFSKDGDAHIVHKGTETSTYKRQHDFEAERSKKFKADVTTTDSDDDVKLIENTQSPIVISEDSRSQDSVILVEDAKDPLADVPTPEPKPQVTPVSAPRKRGRPRKVPLVVREDFGNEMKERIVQPATPISVSSTEQTPAETETTGRPKRSCRAQSVRDTLGIKPRKPSKPRGGKRGAGAKSISLKPEKDPGFSEAKIEVTRKSLLAEEALQAAHSSQIFQVESKKEEPIKPLGLKGLLEAAKDQNIIEVIEVDTPSNSPKRLDKTEEESVAEEKTLDKDISSPDNIVEIKDFEIQKVVLDLRDDDGCNKEPSDFGGADAAASDVEMQPPTPVFAPPLSEVSAVDISSTTDIAMFEEETRMSADASSRAQTPAKQVVSSDVVVEESQSSIQSTATTESGKISRRSRLEVHQDQDGSVFTADQLNEYYWGGNGPFMIQEQVAQFLGIKSFKRKYPGIPRRMVDMQERDYIRENGLASESMCDLGLTAVNSADILDIMYTDFQEKYEEFCRFQRDKQAKDLLNKQKALSLAANQEKSKLDILEQAVQSAAAYNSNFNKSRRDQRRACMDLQTMNIHYPRGKLKKISMPKLGHYPVAVVPGQFTDYYKEFTPTEINNLPLNTMLYTELHKILPEVSDSDSDSSGSDSDDSSSSGSDSNSSCEDNCKMCEKRSITPRKSPVNSSM